MNKKLKLWLVCGVCSFSALAVQGQTPEATPPMPPSPVDQFRSWLEGGTGDMEKALAEYSPEKRAVLQSKIKEYAALPPQERERRLTMIELRHYLQPLMQMPAEDREERLKIVPPSIKPLVMERLKQWDLLDHATQKAVLDSEWASRYFIRLQTARPHERAMLVGLQGGNKEQVENKLAQWKRLPMEERARRYKQFNAFFELPPAKKEEALGHLSDKERAEMEKTLKNFDRLSPQQRSNCIASFRKFANMSPEDRALFLKNAERWKSMPPEDRETWNKLVQSVPPLPTEMPPLPMDGLNEPPMPGK